MEWVFFIAGIAALISTYYKPSFFWEHRKARSMRRLFGDNGTTIIYYLIGLIVTIIGLLAVLGHINLEDQLF